MNNSNILLLLLLCFVSLPTDVGAATCKCPYGWAANGKMCYVAIDPAKMPYKPGKGLWWNRDMIIALCESTGGGATIAEDNDFVRSLAPPGSRFGGIAWFQGHSGGSACQRPQRSVKCGFCPDGWTKFNNNCYLIANNKVSFVSGREPAKEPANFPYDNIYDFCRSLGSEIVSVHSAAENSFILDLAIKKGLVVGKEGLWLGGWRADHAVGALGAWYLHWHDGTGEGTNIGNVPVGQFPWAPGQPNQNSKDEWGFNMVRMDVRNGLWVANQPFEWLAGGGVCCMGCGGAHGPPPPYGNSGGGGDDEEPTTEAPTEECAEGDEECKGGGTSVIWVPMDGSDGYQYIFVVGGGASKGTAVCKQFEMDYVGTVTSAIKQLFAKYAKAAKVPATTPVVVCRRKKGKKPPAPYIEFDVLGIDDPSEIGWAPGTGSLADYLLDFFIVPGGSQASMGTTFCKQLGTEPVLERSTSIKNQAKEFLNLWGLPTTDLSIIVVCKRPKPEVAATTSEKPVETDVVWVPKKGPGGNQYLFIILPGGSKGKAVCKQFNAEYVPSPESAVKQLSTDYCKAAGVPATVKVLFVCVRTNGKPPPTQAIYLPDIGVENPIEIGWVPGTGTLINVIINFFIVPEGSNTEVATTFCKQLAATPVLKKPADVRTKCKEYLKKCGAPDDDISIVVVCQRSKPDSEEPKPTTASPGNVITIDGVAYLIVLTQGEVNDDAKAQAETACGQGGYTMTTLESVPEKAQGDINKTISASGGQLVAVCKKEV